MASKYGNAGHPLHVGFQRGLNFRRGNVKHVSLGSTAHPLHGGHSSGDLLDRLEATGAVAPSLVQKLQAQRAEQARRQLPPGTVRVGGHPLGQDETTAPAVRNSAPLQKFSVRITSDGEVTVDESSTGGSSTEHPLQGSGYKRGLNWTRRNQQTEHPLHPSDDQEGEEDAGDGTQFVAQKGKPAEAKSPGQLKQDFKDGIARIDVPRGYVWGALEMEQYMTNFRMLAHKISLAENMKKKQDDVVDKILSEASVGPRRGRRYHAQGIWDSDRAAMGDGPTKNLQRRLNRFAGSATIIGNAVELALGIKRDIIDPEDLKLSAADRDKVLAAVRRLNTEARGMKYPQRLKLMRDAIREALFGDQAYHLPTWSPPSGK